MLIINRVRFLDRLVEGTVSHVVYKDHGSGGSISYGFDRSDPVPTAPPLSAVQALPELAMMPVAENEQSDDWRTRMVEEGMTMSWWRSE